MDPIANMLTQIKNAGQARQRQTEVNYSKVNIAILDNLKNRGFIQEFEVKKLTDQKYPSKIIVKLKYKHQNEPYLEDIKRVSCPGRRIYIRSGEIVRLSRGKAELFISTSQGIMTGREAHKKGLGGEVICEVK